MQEELQTYFVSKLDSLLKIDLLAFFHRNPYVIGKVEDIATCLGVNIKELADDLDDLVESGIMRKKTGTSGTSYALVPSETVVRMVNAVMEYYSSGNQQADAYFTDIAYEKLDGRFLEQGKANMVKEESSSYTEPVVFNNWLEQLQPDCPVLHKELELLSEMASWITGEKKVAIVLFTGKDYPYCIAKGVSNRTALYLAEQSFSLLAELTTPVLLRSHEYPWLNEGLEEEMDRIILVALTEEKSALGLLLIFNPSMDILQDFRLKILLKKLGHQAVQHLKNRAMLQHYQKLALIDELTGLYNYRFFQKRLHEETARAKRQENNLSLLMIDLDHFKKINDVHGHHEGNKSLQEVAAVFKKVLRETDIICRFGGEEFAVLLPVVDSRGALLAAERIRRAVEDKFMQKGEPRVTISIGISIYPEQAGSPEELLKQADLALYRAKESGRNRCCSY